MGNLNQFFRDLGRNAYGLGENAASLGSAAIAEPVAGFAAMYDPANGAQAIREGMTYTPRTQAGQMYQQGAARTLGAIAQPAMPVIETWQRGVDIAGGYSPAAGAMLRTVPAAIGVAMGAKPALQAGRQVSNSLGAMQARMIANANMPNTINNGFRGQRGTFAGINALTADKEALAKAQGMIAQGVDPEDVWQQTGWGRGADGKWRFEIDDSQIHLHDKHRNDVYFIEDAIGDNQITKAYPKIKDKYLNIGRLDNKISGYDGMIDDAGDIALNRRLTNDGNIKTDDLKSVLLHELQHGIQDREGFARGGNTEQFKKTQLDLEKEKWASIVNQTVNDGESIDSVLNELKKEVLDRGIDDSTYSHDDFNAVLTLIQSKEPKALIEKWIKDGQVKNDPYESYRSLAGEVEARTTQSRMDLNAQQRRENYPFDYKTYGYDVPAKSQTVDFGNNKANAKR